MAKRFSLFTMKCSAFEWIARFGRDRFTLLIAFVTGLGTAHILVRTATYGTAVNYDSTLHLSTALNFLAGEGWRDFTGLVAVGWPPGFTLLLAAIGFFGLDPLEAGRWVNAVAFGLTILAVGLYLHSNLRSRLLALGATVAVMAAFPLTRWMSYFLTEPLFVLFTLLALMQLASFLNRRTGYPPLLGAAVFTALAALTRYPGVALICAAVLLLLPLARLKHTVVFGAISSLPLLAVLAHNWTVSGLEGGYDPFWENDLAVNGRRGSGQSLFAGLSQISAVFSTWVVPPHAPAWAAYLLWLVVGLVLLAGVAVVAFAGMTTKETARAKGTGAKARSGPLPLSFGLGPALPFGGFALVYIVFMAAVMPFTVKQGIGSRYLLPVYVPLLLAAVLLLDRFLSIEAAGGRATIRYGLGGLVLLGALAHVGFSTHRNLIITARAWAAGYEGWSYNAARWQHSETLKYIRDIDGRIYSNYIELAWFADRTAALGKYQEYPVGRAWRIVSGKSPFSRLAQEGMGWTDDGTDAHIVWFWDIATRDVFDYDDLDIRCLPGVEVVAELSDGVVFRATAGTTTEPFDEDRHRARKERYVEQLIQQAQAGERVVRADWDVYRTGRKLAYFKKPCASADTQAKFVLHVIPADPADLPVYRKWYGYDSLGFYFHQRGVQLADQCIATILLPAYAIGRIRVGQWISGEDRPLWEAEFSRS